MPDRPPAPGYHVPMPDSSLLTEDVRALAGVEHRLEPVRVTLRSVRRALEVYFGAPQPASYADGDPVPGYAIAAFESDGESERPDIPRLLPNSLLISNDWQFERPLRLGEEFVRVYSVTNIAERFGGRFGYSIDFRSEIRYIDARGETVARSGSTMTQYDARATREAGDAS